MPVFEGSYFNRFLGLNPDLLLLGLQGLGPRLFLEVSYDPSVQLRLETMT